MYRPDITETELLLAALLGGKQKAGDMNGSSWWPLYQTAAAHHLVPLLSWTADRDQAALPDEKLHRTFKQARMDAAARYLAHSVVQQEVTKILAKANMPVVWLKGGALGPLLYPDAALRSMVDLDVLVPEEQRMVALEALQEAGYQFVSMPGGLHDTNLAALEDKHHHFALAAPGAQAVIVEVHYRLLGADQADQAADQQPLWLLADPLQIAVDEGEITIPRHESHLLYLCGHMAYQHGLDAVDLRWYLDSHWLISKETIDWDGVVDQAVALRWTFAAAAVLQITQQLFDTQIPDRVFDQLEARRPPEEDVQQVLAATGAGAAWHTAWRKIRQYGWQKRIRWIWRIAVPPPAYMRRRYQIPDGAPVGRYYLRRWWYQASRFAASVFQQVGSGKGE